MRLWLILILALASLCGDAMAQNVAIADATVYPSPGATAKTHTTILIHAGSTALAAKCKPQVRAKTGQDSVSTGFRICR